MMKERKLGGKILKSALAILMAAAVLILSLPAFKMDVWAVDDPEGESDYCLSYADPIEGQAQSTSAIMYVVDPFDKLSEGTISSNKRLLVYNGQNIELKGVDLNSVASGEPFGNEWVSGTIYTFNKDVTFKIEGLIVTFSVAGSDSSSSGSDSSSSCSGSGEVVTLDPAAAQKLASDYEALLKGRKALIANHLESERIRKENEIVAANANLWRRNLNEAINNGVSMVVDPETHAATKSNIDGLYFANSIFGFAAQADPLTASNIYVQTWDITDKKSEKALVSIDGKVTDLSGTLIGAVQINIGEKQSDNSISYESNSDTAVANVLFAVPDANANYAIVKVVGDGNGNGNIHVFDQLKVKDGVITLPLPIGQAAYALVKLPAAAQ